MLLADFNEISQEAYTLHFKCRDIFFKILWTLLNDVTCSEMLHKIAEVTENCKKYI